MRRIILLIVLAIVFSMGNTHAQCSDDLADKTYDRLADFTFLKEINVTVDKKYKTKKHPLIFNKGSKYRFTANTDNSNTKPLFKVFSYSGELIASNYDEESKTTYDIFEYTANQTGEYYATLEFNGGDTGCLLGMIGFVY